MKDKSKSWRTNLIGYIGTFLIASCIVLVFLGKSSLEDVLAFIGSLGAVLSVLNSYISKDSRATHSALSYKSIKDIGGNSLPPAEDDE